MFGFLKRLLAPKRNALVPSIATVLPEHVAPATQQPAAQWAKVCYRVIRGTKSAHDKRVQYLSYRPNVNNPLMQEIALMFDPQFQPLDVTPVFGWSERAPHACKFVSREDALQILQLNGLDKDPDIKIYPTLANVEHNG
jgi:hypothetical protein